MLSPTSERPLNVTLPTYFSFHSGEVPSTGGSTCRPSRASCRTSGSRSPTRSTRTGSAKSRSSSSTRPTSASRSGLPCVLETLGGNFFIRLKLSGLKSELCENRTTGIPSGRWSSCSRCSATSTWATATRSRTRGEREDSSKSPEPEIGRKCLILKTHWPQNGTSTSFTLNASVATCNLGTSATTNAA